MNPLLIIFTYSYFKVKNNLILLLQFRHSEMSTFIIKINLFLICKLSKIKHLFFQLIIIKIIKISLKFFHIN